MSVDLTTRCLGSDTRPGEIDTTVTLPIDVDVFNLDWHRTVIHRRVQHGCVLCVPTPCSCGYLGELCPDYFEHRRNDASAEIATWRDAA